MNEGLTSREKELLTTVFTDLLLYDGGEVQSIGEMVACKVSNMRIKEYAKKYEIDLYHIDTSKI